MTRFSLEINMEANAQIMNRKVENICSQFSKWSFHVPN